MVERVAGGVGEADLDVAMAQSGGVAGVADHSDRLPGEHVLADVHEARGDVPVVDVLPGQRAAGDQDDRIVVSTRRLLFDQPLARDVEGKDPGFNVQMHGAFEVGETFWTRYAEAASWIIEIKREISKPLRVVIAPTPAGRERTPAAALRKFAVPDNDAREGPFFDTRILINEGGWGRTLTDDPSSAAGVRVFLEGFKNPNVDVRAFTINTCTSLHS